MPLHGREKWLHASDGYDGIGRRLPRQLGLPDYLLLVARIEPARVRCVPLSATPEDGTDDEGDFALVDCPCGTRPVVRDGLQKCLGCERYYVLVRPRVFVTYGAMTPPPLAA